MELWQTVIISLYTLTAAIGLILAYRQSRYKNNAYGHPPKIYGFFGAFVWADLVVFGAFWALSGLASLILNDWLLFLLIISLFWLVRSVGESLYWFFQQFSPRKGNAPEKFWIHKVFRNDSVYFVHQIYWQCVTVVTIITSLYLGNLWLQG